MSEPLSAVEIEDVLSSIRRLVSEDLRPAARAAAQPAPAGRADAGSPALILTPALRVVPDAEPARVSPAAGGAVEQAVHAVAEQAKAQEWEPETGDALPVEVEPVWAEAAWDPVDDTALPVEADEDATDVARVLADAEDAPPAGWAQPASDEPGSHEVSDARVSVVDEADPAPMDADWVAQAEAEVIAGLQQDRPDASPFEVLEDEREVTFDEEVLRDLVRDLIREELQGHLGARITRNIRKLVRAEIARAMSVQDIT